MCYRKLTFAAAQSRITKGNVYRRNILWGGGINKPHPASRDGAKLPPHKKTCGFANDFFEAGLNLKNLPHIQNGGDFLCKIYWQNCLHRKNANFVQSQGATAKAY